MLLFFYHPREKAKWCVRMYIKKLLSQSSSSLSSLLLTTMFNKPEHHREKRKAEHHTRSSIMLWKGKYLCCATDASNYLISLFNGFFPSMVSSFFISHKFFQNIFSEKFTTWMLNLFSFFYKLHNAFMEGNDHYNLWHIVFMSIIIIIQIPRILLSILCIISFKSIGKEY